MSQDSSMGSKGMKIVGGRNLPPPFWERFSRLQQTSHLLLGRGVGPRGVFRFKSFEEFEEWKDRYRFQEPSKKMTW